MKNKKLNIAILAGGYTGEHDVSLKSAEMIITSIDRDLFNPYLIVWSDSKKTSDRGATLHYNGKLYPIDLTYFTAHTPDGILSFDYAYIAIHGSPGEDGKLQGYLDMMQIPYNTSGVFAQAITFHKEALKNFVKGYGVIVPNGLLVNRGEEDLMVEKMKKEKSIHFPLFVKPCQGGSSIATTKVKNTSSLCTAIKRATEADLEGVALVEEAIEGVEVTCGVMRLSSGVYPLAITEVVPKGFDFFDFEAKYSGKSDEITPARIEGKKTEEIFAITKKLGDILDLRAIYRADFIIDNAGTPYLLEVNTVPGFTSESFIPKQIRSIGKTPTEIISQIIADTIPID